MLVRRWAGGVGSLYFLINC